MRFPVLTEYATYKDNTEQFAGYNHNARIANGEWHDQRNMTMDHYPVAATREKRALVAACEDTHLYTEQATYDVTGNQGMVYTDDALITLADVKKNGEPVGQWLFRNGELVAMDEAIPFAFDTAQVSYPDAQPLQNDMASIVTGEKMLIENITVDTQEIAVGDEVRVQLYRVAEYTANRPVYERGRSISGVVEGVTETSVLLTITSFTVSKANWADIKGTLKLDLVTPKQARKSNLPAESVESYLKYFTYGQQKQVVRMGSYLCVLPDGVVYEPENTTAPVPVFRIESSCDITSISVDDGKYYINMACARKSDSGDGWETVFGSGADNTQFIFNENKWRIQDDTLQEYLSDQGLWVTRQAYTMITYSQKRTADEAVISPVSVPKVENMFGDLDVGDTVTLALQDTVDANRQVYGIVHADYDNPESYVPCSKKIIDKGKWSDGREYIVVEGLTYAKRTKDKVITTESLYRGDHLTLTRKKPDFASIGCESQNRLWSCSRDGHEIYASTLGKPYNFYDFSGIATDSYAVNVGTYGQFTGCINFLGRPLFFKENALHYVTGSYPTNGGELDSMSYAVTQVTDFKGVEKGSERSLAIIDNVLYYKSSAGIVAYDGSMTSVISYQLGNGKYKNAVAGAYKNKYYVSMEDADGKWHLFVYDTRYGAWCHEDNVHVKQFLNVNNMLVFADADTGRVYNVCDEDIFENGDYQPEGDFEWMCETGTLGYSYPNNKYLSRLQLRLQLAAGAKAALYMQYNSDGVWHKKGELYGKGTRTHLLPIVPMRCDHLKMKLEGSGEVQIFSIAKIFEEGGDR
ncbi:MAG: hypothetical protein IJ168_08085 [Eubacterium sp.]|nr:hypothetical protein [Eubacterium sp.]